MCVGFFLFLVLMSVGWGQGGIFVYIGRMGAGVEILYIYEIFLVFGFDDGR